MSNSQARVINERSAASELGRYVTPPSHLVGKMRNYDYGKDPGVKPSHIYAFTYACSALDVILLLRTTNTASISWMEKNGYVAKPIDCKAKTADRNGDANGNWVACAGLVVSPIVLGKSVFGNKLVKAEKAWGDFEHSLGSEKLSSGVQIYLRHEKRGFYAVDTFPSSSHYGCLMVSDQMPPDDFDPKKSHSRRWMEINMSYLHGDYDLYGIIDYSGLGELRPGQVQESNISEGQLLGQKSFTTAKSKAVEESINLIIGDDMVKHGEQSAYEHSVDDDVYIFYPSGDIQVVSESQFKHPSEMANYFQDLYRYVFKTAYSGQDEGVRQRTGGNSQNYVRDPRSQIQKDNEQNALIQKLIKDLSQHG